MAEILLYGLKNCDTCKKALKALEDSGRNVIFVDIRAEADLATNLPRWLAAGGPETLVNKRSTTWRNLSDADRKKADTVAAAEGLLANNPTLIKRPVIEVDSKVFIGWTKDVSTALA
jgi:arsenate reductase